MAKYKTETIKAPGKKPIKFKKGKLHTALNVKQGEKIPASKMSAAMKGDYGATAMHEAMFAKNVLKGRGGKKKK